MEAIKLVVVEWEDITTDSNWVVESDDDLMPILTHSVGWQLSSHDGYVRIAAVRNARDACSMRQVIPKGCIKSMRIVEE